MAFARFSPNSVDKNISSALTRMNFNSLIKDYNNGLLALGENAKYSAVNVEVFNVKKDNTVSCTIKVLNRTINRSYTSKYDDTIVRNIYEELDIPESTTTLMNSIISNNGDVDVSITSGTSNFRAPVNVWFEFTTAVRNGMTDKDLSIDGDKIDKPIRIYRTDGNVGMYVTLQSKATGAASSTIIFKKASNTNYVEIPAGTIKDLNATHTAYVNAGAVLESYGDIKFDYGSGNASAIAQLNNLSLSLPTLSNLSTVGDLWEKSIDVNWRSENQEGYEYETYYNNELKTKGTGGVQTGFTIPAKTFPGTLPASIRVRVYRTYNGIKYYSGWQEASLRLKDIEASISNLLVSGDLWETPINLSWQSINQQQFKIEVLKNNVVIKTYTGTTAQNYTIPAGQLSKGEYVFKVWVGYSNRFVNNQTRSVTLKDIEATISNLLVEGEFWEKPIKLSWKSVNQEQFKIEVFNGNALVATYTGTTATSYIIQSEQLTDGSHTFKVWVGYKNRLVNYNEKNVSLRNIYASVNNLNLSGANIDLDLTFAWSSTDQQKYEVEIYKDADRVKFYSGTTGTSVLILHSSLTNGLHKFKVRVAFKDRWTEWQEVNATLTETLPSIGVLEPDGVITERDNPTRVWWTSQNQSKWKIIVDENITYTGTTEKEKVLLPGTFQIGQHSILLTVWYVTTLGVEKTPVTKKAEWIVQGKPPTPTITSNTSFTTNRPTITWDTQNQQGYILEVLKGDVVIYSSDWLNGLIVEHKINEYLEDGTYTVRVKIKNQFSYESDYGTKQITINAQESTPVTLKAIRVENSIRLTWDNLSNKFIKFYIIRNGKVIAKTTDTFYLDHTAFGECIYTVRGITSTDVYKDSNKLYLECIINYGIMATVDKLDEAIDVGLMRNEFEFDGSIHLESENIMLSGRELPVTIFGEHSTNTFNLKFVENNKLKFLSMCKKRLPFLYRDDVQKLYITITTPTYRIDKFGLEYGVQAMEVDYNEAINYD